MCGQPPFSAQIILKCAFNSCANGHEYVACQARANKSAPIEFDKDGNCFIHTSNAEGLQKVNALSTLAPADALRSDDAPGLLKQICERWIYTTGARVESAFCLCFALNTDEQARCGFRYQYSSFQIEYSRNLQFREGGQNALSTLAPMEQVVQSLIDRTRVSLGARVESAFDLVKVKTIMGYKLRPWKKKFRAGRYEVIVEKPE